MELQTLQEALKVEIQVHQKLVAQMKQDPQNADLKKQLHELQAKITALSEKQYCKAERNASVRIGRQIWILAVPLTCVILDRSLNFLELPSIPL